QRLRASAGNRLPALATLRNLLFHTFRRPFREPVADVAVGQKIFGFRRIVFQLLAQLPNESPQIFQLASILRTPNRPQQPHMRNRQPRMRHQIVQQVELRRRKVHRLAPLANQSASRIKFDVPNSDYRVGIDMGCGRTSHRGPYACCQLADVEWLGDVVVRACIQRRHLVPPAVAPRKNRNPQVGKPLAYPAARPDPSIPGMLMSMSTASYWAS